MRAYNNDLWKRVRNPSLTYFAQGDIRRVQKTHDQKDNTTGGITMATTPLLNRNRGTVSSPGCVYGINTGCLGNKPSQEPPVSRGILKARLFSHYRSALLYIPCRGGFIFPASSTCESPTGNLFPIRGFFSRKIPSRKTFMQTRCSWLFLLVCNQVWTFWIDSIRDYITKLSFKTRFTRCHWACNSYFSQIQNCISSSDYFIILFSKFIFETLYLYCF